MEVFCADFERFEWLFSSLFFKLFFIGCILHLKFIGMKRRDVVNSLKDTIKRLILVLMCYHYTQLCIHKQRGNGRITSEFSAYLNTTAVKLIYFSIEKALS